MFSGYSVLLDVWESLTKEKVGSCSQGADIIVETNERTVRNMNDVWSFRQSLLCTLYEPFPAVWVTEGCRGWERRLPSTTEQPPPAHPCWAGVCFLSLSLSTVI